MADVKVSWLAFDTAATPVDVRVSWVAFDTAAAPCDVKVSWVCLDTSAPQTNEPSPVSGGGGGLTYRAPRYARPDSYDVPIIDHDEEDEEEIVLSLLTRIAHMEYFA